MTSTGTTAFLQQAHRNNWQRYLASLQPDARRGWDACVLTTSDERQAEMCYSCFVTPKSSLIGGQDDFS